MPVIGFSRSVSKGVPIKRSSLTLFMSVLAAPVLLAGPASATEINGPGSGVVSFSIDPAEIGDTQTMTLTGNCESGRGFNAIINWSLTGPGVNLSGQAPGGPNVDLQIPIGDNFQAGEKYFGNAECIHDFDGNGYYFPTKQADPGDGDELVGGRGYGVTANKGEQQVFFQYEEGCFRVVAGENGENGEVAEEGGGGETDETTSEEVVVTTTSELPFTGALLLPLLGAGLVLFGIGAAVRPQRN